MAPKKERKMKEFHFMRIWVSHVHSLNLYGAVPKVRAAKRYLFYGGVITFDEYLFYDGVITFDSHFLTICTGEPKALYLWFARILVLTFYRLINFKSVFWTLVIYSFYMFQGIEERRLLDQSGSAALPLRRYPRWPFYFYLYTSMHGFSSN